MKRSTTSRAIPALVGLFVLTLATPTSAAPISRLSNVVADGLTSSTAQQTGDIELAATVLLDGRGTDIEFASREVVKLSEGATGDPMCELDELGACQVDADGKPIFQREVRDFAVVGIISEFARVIDVTDPANMVDVAAVPCRANQNDIQIQGDLLLIAHQIGVGRCTLPDGSIQSINGSALVDFSDPRDPTYLSSIQHSSGSHNHTLHPTEPLVYLSDSGTATIAADGGGPIPIWDISDPTNPVLVTVFTYLFSSPHDITFNADGTRAYAAAITATYILNTEDPRNPSVIATIPTEGISISHQADPTPDGKYLLVSDELGGGAVGVSPGGPVHVYDIRNETRPVKIGVIWPDCLPQSCHSVTGFPVSTSHVFRINPDGFTMAIAWYKDGAGVIDFSAIRGTQLGGSGEGTGLGPRVLAWASDEITNSWAAKMWQQRHPGYLFATDIGAFHSFFIPEMGPGFLSTGTIDSGTSAGITQRDFEDTCDYTPAAQGVDGWVAQIPTELADGTHTLTATGSGLAELDAQFYRDDCSPLTKTEPGAIPADATYVLVTGLGGAGPERIHLSTQ